MHTRMLRWVELLSWPALSLAGLFALVLLWRACRRPRGCPGPAPRRFFAALAWSPLCLLPWRTCGYELRGLPTTGPTAGICPECGTRHGLLHTPRLAPARFLAPLLWAALFAAAGWSAWNIRWLRHGGWMQPLPTGVLISIAHATSGPTAEAAIEELLRRNHRWLPGPVTQAHTVSFLIRRLGDDDIRYSALDARWTLNDLRGGMVTEQLSAALTSPDRQRRDLAASALIVRAMPGSGAPEADGPLSPRLIHVFLESQRLDAPEVVYAGQLQRWSGISSTASPLAPRPPRLAPPLPDPLSTGDPRQRLVAAATLARVPDQAPIPLILPVLLAHLQDNTIRRDAIVAAEALTHLGSRARPWLESCRSHPDAQLRTFADQFCRRLDGQTLSWKDQLALHRILETNADVLANLKPEPLGRPGLVEHATASLTSAPSQPQHPSQP
ncbi:MAG: hypothetical protein ACK5ZV_04450 [bacterium]